MRGVASRYFKRIERETRDLHAYLLRKIRDPSNRKASASVDHGTKRIFLGLVIGCILGLFHKDAMGGFPLFSQFSGGANLGWLPEKGAAAGLEISYSMAVFTGSVGADRLPGKKEYIYGEACMWMFVNFGFGWGLTLSDSSPEKSGHLFLGVPFPLVKMETADIPRYFFYAEPYWRPIIQFKEWKSVGNEFGVLIKFGFRPEHD